MRESGFRTEVPNYRDDGVFPSGHNTSIPSIIFSYDERALKNHAPRDILVTATVYIDKTAEALELIAAEEKRRQEEEKLKQECETLQKQLDSIRIQINDECQIYKESYNKTYGTLSGSTFVSKMTLLNQWLVRIEETAMRNRKGELDAEMIVVRNHYLRQTHYKAIKEKYSESDMIECFNNARLLLNLKPFKFDKKITPNIENLPEMKRQYFELVNWSSQYESRCENVIDRYYAEFTTIDQDYCEAEIIDKVIRIMNVSSPKIRKNTKKKMSEWSREQLEEYFLNLEIE